MATGERQWYIIGCYLSPDNNSTIDSVVAALKERPQVLELLVTGGLNTNLENLEGDQREKEIEAELTMAGLEDMSAHFIPRWRPWFRYGRMWRMVCLGRELHSWTDYILGTYRVIFRSVATRYPRHNSGHYMVLGCLCSALLREYAEYLRSRIRLPLHPPTTPAREDGIFAALRRATPKPKSQEARKNMRISVETWRLVD